MYRRFGAEDAKQHIFSPYALKVYNKRWYVLAFFDARVEENGEKRDAHFTIFSFDRIENVKILKDKFKIDPNFNLKEYFQDSYGIQEYFPYCEIYQIQMADIVKEGGALHCLTWNIKK